MPFYPRALGTVLCIVAVAAVTIAAPVRAQQAPPPAGQEAAPDAKPPGDPATTRATTAQAPTAEAPATPPPPRSQAGAVRSGPGRAAAVTATVNLRSGPGTDSDVITTIPAGSRVRITGCDGEWCSVTWNGNSGYAIARNLGAAAPRQAGTYRGPPGYAEEYEAGPPAVYGAPGYYPPPAVVYGPAYYGPGYYYGRGWGGRRRW